MLQMNKHSSS